MVIATGHGGATIDRREQVRTTDPASTLQRVRETIATICGGERIDGLGIATFGPIDLRRSSDSFGELLDTPKPGWAGVNVLRLLSNGLDAPVGIDTDVNAAVLAEKMWGAGTGADSILYLTVGTGIGGGVWADGAVLHGANHPEIGHIRVQRHPEDRHPSSCPFHEDCLEGMASGPALRERWGRDPEDLGDRIERATDLEAWYLARGIASVCTVVPVQLVVVGGGVSNLPGLHDLVAEKLAEASGTYPSVPFGEGGPQVVAPGLAGDAGVIGAIELGRIATRGQVAKSEYSTRRGEL